MLDDATQRLVAELNKTATQQKKAKDWPAAIATMREAIAAVEGAGVACSVDNRIRLAQFLQESGEFKEAWSEFSRTLLRTARQKHWEPSTGPMVLHGIFDKMRLSLEREGKDTEAELFSIFTDTAWLVGLQRQGRNDEIQFDAEIDRESLTALRAQAGQGLIGKLCNAIASGMDGQTQPDYDAIGRRIEEALTAGSQMGR